MKKSGFASDSSLFTLHSSLLTLHSSLFTPQAFRTDALDDILRFDDVIPLWYGNSRDGHILQAYRLVTLYARKVYVTLVLVVMSVMAAPFIIIVQTMAYTIFLHSRTVIDGVYQLLFSKER